MRSSLVSDKMNWVTSLRVVATFGVIFLHVASQILNQYGSISDFVWWTGNIYDSSVRFCVPIFVMLTGTLMLNRSYELSDFLKKRFSRIVLPFLFWSFIYAIFALNDKISGGYELSSVEIIKFLVRQFKNGSAYHLWYIYMIIGIYFFIPILNKWIQNATEKEIIYFLAVWFISLIINQPILSKFMPDINLIYFSGFIGYVVLGYYLSIKSFKLNHKIIYLLSLFLIIIGISITIFGNYFLSHRNGIFESYFLNYITLNVLMVSVGVFLFFKNFEISNPVVAKASIFISKYSYGIYLIHVLILRFMKKMKIDYDFVNPIVAIPIATLLCLLISVLVIYFINKLPYGKYISG